MKITTVALASAAALALSAGAAQAQRWMPIVEREAMFDDHVAAALAAGDISPAQAGDLRADMDALVVLEGRMRYGGLSARERLELDRRYGDLDAQLRVARADPPDRWASLDERKQELDRRIERGVANGDLTAAEADDLRDDFDAIASAEARYRLDGLSAAERADLDRQFDALSARIRSERQDRQYGYNRY